MPIMGGLIRAIRDRTGQIRRKLTVYVAGNRGANANTDSGGKTETTNMDRQDRTKKNNKKSESHKKRKKRIESKPPNVEERVVQNVG